MAAAAPRSPVGQGPELPERRGCRHPRCKPFARMHIAIVLALTGLTLALGACATEREWRYSKPDVTAVEFDRDREECAKQAVEATGRPPRIAPIGLDRERFNACMADRGYSIDRTAVR
jgi:hypothetical protein